MRNGRMIQLPHPLGASGATLLAMKAAFSALFQRRRGSRAPARELYYSAHSLLRALRRHVVAPSSARPAA